MYRHADILTHVHTHVHACATPPLLEGACMHTLDLQREVQGISFWQAIRICKAPGHKQKHHRHLSLLSVRRQPRHRANNMS